MRGYQELRGKERPGLKGIAELECQDWEVEVCQEVRGEGGLGLKGMAELKC